MKVLHLIKETILYRVKDIQTPELDKFKSSAKLMKLKMDVKQSPNKKETIIRLQGNKKTVKRFRCSSQEVNHLTETRL